MPPSAEPVLTRFRLKLGWRWLSWGMYCVLLTVIVHAAADLRFRLPQTPIVDPDFWGYLHPALSSLSGGPFEHTLGRNFVYPAFLYAVLRVCGDFQGIAVAQHTVGLLTGLLLAGFWNVLCGFLAGPAWSRTLARFPGLAFVAIFLLSRWTILFEQSVRPEAVFPFFVALSLLLNVTALHAGYVAPRPRLEMWCLGLNFFVVAVAQSLKPSTGFGVVAANAPLAVFLCRRGIAWQAKGVTTTLAVAVTALTLWLPERLLARHDFMAAFFLPATLLTIHARYIDTQIKDDLRTGHNAPWNAKWLARFDQQLETTLATSSHDPGAYRTLGFNPDDLMYNEPVFFPAFRLPQDQQVMTEFCLDYYRRTLLHQPGPMLAKVGAQLAEVYRPSLKRGAKHRYRRWFTVPEPEPPRSLRADYQRAVTCWQTENRQETLLAVPGGQACWDLLRILGDTSAAVDDPRWVQGANVLLARWHLPMLGLALLTGLSLLASSWRENGPLVAGVWLCWTLNFLMFLTVAVVHSLEPQRYVENQRICTLAGEFATLLLAWQGATLLLNRLRADYVTGALRSLRTRFTSSTPTTSKTG